MVTAATLQSANQILVGSKMSKTVSKSDRTELEQEPAIEAIKRMIRYTKKNRTRTAVRSVPISWIWLFSPWKMVPRTWT